jgi:hypothetical protein
MLVTVLTKSGIGLLPSTGRRPVQESVSSTISTDCFRTIMRLMNGR